MSEKNNDLKKPTTNKADDFVTQQMNQNDVDTAIAISTDKKGNIDYSFNSKSDMSKIAQALAALIENQSKSNPMFRHEFVKALGTINGIEGYEVGKILEPQHIVRNPRESQKFVNDVMQYIETELQPTGLILMLTNADPSMVEQDPSQPIPFTYHLTGSTNLMAYGMHSLYNQLTGEAYKRNIPNAMSPEDENNATAMRLFTSTWDTLEEMDKRIDHMDDKAKK